jgi:ArsR family transcriptional regulator, arsenate/arsenite/antimonite-responsive transcriptional repressor
VDVHDVLPHFNYHRDIETIMDEKQALSSFAALSQETRFRIVRLLVRAGPDGLPAGSVSEAVGASSSNVSFHLSHLEQAGLIQSRREARRIIYTVRYEALSDLVQFLMRDCCQGRPEVCEPAMAALAARSKPRKKAVNA